MTATARYGRTPFPLLMHVVLAEPTERGGNLIVAMAEVDRLKQQQSRSPNQPRQVAAAAARVRPAPAITALKPAVPDRAAVCRRSADNGAEAENWRPEVCASHVVTYQSRVEFTYDMFQLLFGILSCCTRAAPRTSHGRCCMERLRRELFVLESLLK